MAVTALSASDVSDHLLQSQLEPAGRCRKIRVSLYRLELGEAFTSGADFTGRELPSGWGNRRLLRRSFLLHAVETPSLRNDHRRFTPHHGAPYRHPFAQFLVSAPTP